MNMLDEGKLEFDRKCKFLKELENFLETSARNLANIY
jgi:hypothetical protein